ncbi:MAG: ATP-binding protein [Chloroflexi bacterium]|nr:ATP-binding protein [Chloroflexota bacterium]
MGFVYPAVAEAHPDFGQAMPCACTQQELESERLARLQRYSNLGPLVRMTFESLVRGGRSGDPTNQERFQGALDAAQAYAGDPQGWFVITGSSGSGKTHLAAAIANALLAQGSPALFVVVPDLLDHLRAAFNPASAESYDQLFEQVRAAPCLVLDDLGAQSSTPWAQEKLYQILSHRYSAQLPTVVTAAGPLETLDERLRTRLCDPEIAQVWSLEEHADVLYQYRGALALELLSQMTFRNYEPEGMNATAAQQQTLRAAFDNAVRFAREPEGWLVFIGPHGSGKTHLAAAIANAQLQQGKPVFFVVVPDLLDHLRAAFAPESKLPYDALFEGVRTTPLLILDDLGTQSSSPWAREKLFQLLNYRYNGRLPTVITLSCGLDELAQVSPALTSRIVDPRGSIVIHIDAPDYRTQERLREQERRPTPRYGRGRR